MIRNKEKIIKVIEMFFPSAKIYLFGSWARGDQMPTSDVDVAIDIGKQMPLTERAQIKTMIDALNIPQEVDIVDFQTLPEAVKKNILAEGVVWKDSKTNI